MPCLTRHLRSTNVVETGVAHGVTFRFILEDLKKNGAGHLWSIDRLLLEHVWHGQISIAVREQLRHRWTYVEGSSRRRLPRLSRQLGAIDLFIQDSLHSESNVRFEVDRASESIRPVMPLLSMTLMPIERLASQVEKPEPSHAEGLCFSC